MQQCQFGRYIKRLALVTLCLLLLASGISWFVNPYDIYNSPRVAKFNTVKSEALNYSRTTKAYAVRKIKPTAICLGNSRAYTGIDPEHAGWSYSPVYNLAFEAAKIYAVKVSLEAEHELPPIFGKNFGLRFQADLTAGSFGWEGAFGLTPFKFKYGTHLGVGATGTFEIFMNNEDE